MRRAVGCMTGTSIDGIDAALVEIEGEGLTMRARFLRGVSRELGQVRDPLRRLADQHPMTAGDIAGAMREFALVHVAAIESLLGAEMCDLICVHGQTIFHKPPASWQLMQPAPIARRFGVPVVFDLRAADLAAGGQGAPITPIADWVLFRAESKARVVVNLGGFCNITRLYGDDVAPGQAVVEGRDLCACNQLLDAIARRRLGRPYDENGQAAGCGVVNSEIVETLGAILSRQASTGRSLGTGDELEQQIARFDGAAPNELARSACEAIARVVRQYADASLVILAGGGTRNATLVGAIRAVIPEAVTTTETFGVPGELREAACFAVLGALCQDRVPITLPQVTGVPDPAPISGCWVLP